MTNEEFTDDGLVDSFGNAALRAGRSNGGLSINASCGGDWASVQNWRAAVKLRMKELRAAAEDSRLAAFHREDR